MKKFWILLELWNFLFIFENYESVKKFEIGPKNFDCNNKGKNEMEDFNHKI